VRNRIEIDVIMYEEKTLQGEYESLEGEDPSQGVLTRDIVKEKKEETIKRSFKGRFTRKLKELEQEIRKHNTLHHFGIL